MEDTLYFYITSYHYHISNYGLSKSDLFLNIFDVKLVIVVSKLQEKRIIKIYNFHFSIKLT